MPVFNQALTAPSIIPLTKYFWIKGYTKMCIRDRSGGGVSLAEGSMLDMSGGSIHSNTARRQGGGLWKHGGSTAILTGGDIFLNQAGVGGGIYNDIGSQVYKLKDVYKRQH